MQVLKVASSESTQQGVCLSFVFNSDVQKKRKKGGKKKEIVEGIQNMYDC